MGALVLHLNVNTASQLRNKGIPMKPALIRAAAKYAHYTGSADKATVRAKSHIQFIYCTYNEGRGGL